MKEMIIVALFVLATSAAAYFGIDTLHELTTAQEEIDRVYWGMFH